MIGNVTVRWSVGLLYIKLFDTASISRMTLLLLIIVRWRSANLSSRMSTSYLCLHLRYLHLHQVLFTFHVLDLPVYSRGGRHYRVITLDGVATLIALLLKSPQCRSFIRQMAPLCTVWIACDTVTRSRHRLSIPKGYDCKNFTMKLVQIGVIWWRNILDWQKVVYLWNICRRTKLRTHSVRWYRKNVKFLAVFGPQNSKGWAGEIWCRGSN